MPKGNTPEFAKLDVEAAGALIAMAALTNSGDNKIFNSGASLLSDNEGFSPDIKPDGLNTGGAVTPGTGNDAVDVAALTCYQAGISQSVSAAAGESITRGVTNGYRINSITVDNAQAIAVVTGTESTAFSEARGVAGSAPYIPTDSIEIAQVRTTSITAAPVTAAEIFAVKGTHTERWDFPQWDEVWETGQVEMITALPLVHTGDVTKRIFMEAYDPIFAEIVNAKDFVAPENSYSVNSEEVYNATVGSSSKSLNQGSFSAIHKDGISDFVATLEEQTLWFRFYPDRNKAPHILCQGKLGRARAYTLGALMSGAYTISASQKATDKLT